LHTKAGNEIAESFLHYMDGNADPIRFRDSTRYVAQIGRVSEDELRRLIELGLRAIVDRTARPGITAVETFRVMANVMALQNAFGADGPL
jgi:hypothetical protein